MLDRTETVIGELRVSADRRQRDRLLEFAASFEPRTWAIEGATGLGALLAQQLVAAGETVLDVPPTLSARVRLLDTGRTDKTDPTTPARRDRGAATRPTAQVRPVDHTAVLRLLADRHHDLTGLRTQAICRLHALLCLLTPGGALRALSATRPGGSCAASGHPTPVDHRTQAHRPGPARRCPPVRQPARHAQRAHRRSGSRLGHTVTEVHGVGPIGAAIILGHTGDITRFPERRALRPLQRHRPDRSLQRAQGIRHRLNPRGNRQLNHAIHMAAVTQIRNDTPGRVYYHRKLAEGKTRKEALRALKRRISDAVYRQLLADARPDTRGPGRAHGDDSQSSVTGPAP